MRKYFLAYSLHYSHVLFFLMYSKCGLLCNFDRKQFNVQLYHLLYVRTVVVNTSVKHLLNLL